MSKELRESIKDWSTIVAIWLGGAWALWTFVYEQRLKPLAENSYLRPTLTLELAGVPGTTTPLDAIPVLAKVTLENVSKRKVRILSGELSVHGDRLKTEPATDFTPANLAATLNKDKAARAKYFGKHETSELVFAGSAFRLWIFEPGERQEFSRLVWLPRSTFHQLEANLYVHSTPDMGSLCTVNTMNPKFESEVIPGTRADGKCTSVAPESMEAKKLMEDVHSVESTAYLVLPGANALAKQ